MKRFALWAVLALCAGGADRARAGFIPGDVFAKNFDGDIYNITAGGNLTAAPKFSDINSFSDVGHGAFSADLSTMYVSNRSAGSVYAVNSSGVASVFASGLSAPMGLLHTANGRLLVCEYGSNEVTDITAGGNFAGVAPFASGLINPEDLAQTTDGRIFVSETESNEISNITSGGVIGPANVFASGEDETGT